MNKWVCTDTDTLQYCKKVDDYSWSYIEARTALSQEDVYREIVVVCHAVVDIRDYTLNDLWQYCSGYYNSFEQMVQQYGFREAIRIMTECVFEQLSFDDMEFNIEQSDFGEANNFIHKYITNELF